MSSTLRLALLFATATSAAAQNVTLHRVTGKETPVLINGDRPAIDAGEVAFLGSDATTGVWGIYRTAADGSGPFTLIVDENTPIPNVPNETFHLDNPEIREGVVAFTGDRGASNTIRDGIYMGSGGAITVFYDHSDPTSGPNPFMPTLEPEGLVFRHVGSNSSNFLDWTFPYFMDGPNQISGLPTPNLPGGGTLVKLTETGEIPAFGGGEVAFSARVSHGSSIDSGVYTWNVLTQELRLVANWETPMPGTGTQFDYYSKVDTDGDRVAFIGSFGHIAFGGHQGVYLVPLTWPLRAIGLNGAPPLPRKIVEIGDPVPGTATTFGSFQTVAVEGDLVVFAGMWDGNSGRGLYGWRDGVVFEIVQSEKVWFGESFSGFDTNTRCLDGNQVAFRATYAGKWATDFALFTATID